MTTTEQAQIVKAVQALAIKYDQLAQRFHLAREHSEPFNTCPSDFCRYAAKAFDIANETERLNADLNGE